MSIAPGAGRFPDRLKAALKRAGLNQDGFAEKLGAGQSTVNAWLRGRSLPEGKYLVQMPRMLGVSGHWLLTGEPPETVSGQGGELAVAAVKEELRRRVLEAVEAALAAPSTSGGSTESELGASVETPAKELDELARLELEATLGFPPAHPRPGATPRKRRRASGPE